MSNQIIDEGELKSMICSGLSGRSYYVNWRPSSNTFHQEVLVKQPSVCSGGNLTAVGELSVPIGEAMTSFVHDKKGRFYIQLGKIENTNITDLKYDSASDTTVVGVETKVADAYYKVDSNGPIEYQTKMEPLRKPVSITFEVYVHVEPTAST